jgi:hypothetical protein
MMNESHNGRLVGLAPLAPDPLVGAAVPPTQASPAMTTPQNKSAPGPWVIASRMGWSMTYADFGVSLYRRSISRAAAPFLEAQSS